MKGRSWYSGIIVFALVTLCATFGGTIAFAADETAAVDKVRIDFNAAFNAGDADAIERVFDAEGTLLPPGMPAVTGRENIGNRYRDLFRTTRFRFELRSGDIRVCDGWAFMNVEFARTDIPKAGGGETSVEGYCVLVLKKQPDGSWKIFRDIWNEAPKP
jgi:uncharacterized protein (TIGR02246 family)